MIKKLLVTFILLTCLNISSEKIYATTQEYTQYTTDQITSFPSELKSAIDKIHKLPEARQLIAKAQQEGLIKIRMNATNAKQFDAFWEGTSRSILINYDRHVSEGSLICSLLFELHNASTNTTIDNLTTQAWYKQIDKETYVEQMERMEHANALHTLEIIDKGVRTGIFPQSTQWSILRNFDDHYKMQQISGHSEWFANTYDSVNPNGHLKPYQGTIPGLKQMSQQDKQDMIRYLALKRDIDNSNPAIAQKARTALEKEIQTIDSARANNTYSDSRTNQKRYLLQVVFNGDPFMMSKK